MDSTYFLSCTYSRPGGGGANRNFQSLKCLFSLSCGTHDRGGGWCRSFSPKKSRFLWTPHAPFHGLHILHFMDSTCSFFTIPLHGLHKSVGLHASNKAWDERPGLCPPANTWCRKEGSDWRKSTLGRETNRADTAGVDGITTCSLLLRYPYQLHYI